MRIIAVVAVTAGILATLLITSGKASAEANEENAGCMGIGSSFYGLFAPQQPAQVAHLVKESFAQAPGERYRLFAQEKEGGTIPAPCGTRIE